MVLDLIKTEDNMSEEISTHGNLEVARLRAEAHQILVKLKQSHLLKTMICSCQNFALLSDILFAHQNLNNLIDSFFKLIQKIFMKLVIYYRYDC